MDEEGKKIMREDWKNGPDPKIKKVRIGEYTIETKGIVENVSLIQI